MKLKLVQRTNAEVKLRPLCLTVAIFTTATDTEHLRYVFTFFFKTASATATSSEQVVKNSIYWAA